LRGGKPPLFYERRSHIPKMANERPKNPFKIFACFGEEKIFLRRVPARVQVTRALIPKKVFTKLAMTLPLRERSKGFKTVVMSVKR
jgi:hypothetical protein